jgi:hypothetical protein
MNYVSVGVTAELISTAPKNGEITLSYEGLFLAISYWDTEDVQLLPR